MLNIVGSIMMTIQPIYQLFEKAEKAKNEAYDNLPTTDPTEYGTFTQTEASSENLSTGEVP